MNLGVMASYSVSQRIPCFLFLRVSSLKSNPSPVLISSRSHSKAGALTQNEEHKIAHDDESSPLPKEFYDDEWQAKQREKTKEWQADRRKELDEEERKTNEYREIGTRLKDYPEEELRKARMLVSDFITAGEEIEERIEQAADKGELTELVLMIIWNRLDLARRDEERDAVRSLDLLYRRIETEILKRTSSPSMRLLNELLNLHDGFDDDNWIKECKKLMFEKFPREDPFSLMLPPGFDLANSQGRIEIPPEDHDLLLRIDFIREVEDLLNEVRSEIDQVKSDQESGFDPESVATRFKQQEKQRTVRQVESILELAISFKG